MYAEIASKTADAVAAARATGDWDPRPIFRDPMAIRLTSASWRRLLSFAPLRALVTGFYEWALGGLLGLVQARSRYTEERLAASGVRQYVLLGAGLDSFALRSEDLESRVRVFELDHPATQAVKRERISRAGFDLPRHLSFVPIDFERETIEQALARGGFDPTEPALFAWLGVIPYLTEDAIEKVWRSVAWVAAPGSEIVFDYIVRDAFVPGSPLYTEGERQRTFAARRGEPLITGLDPATLRNRLAANGLTLVEDLSPEETERRFRPEGGRPCSKNFRIARARVGKAGIGAISRREE
ncbi:MAG: class I SAM-dependent methyltransferase [Labilithrix sp.]|nr:class I SAM-dependent methyltransferase [Labilithrix sp.]